MEDKKITELHLVDIKLNHRIFNGLEYVDPEWFDEHPNWSFEDAARTRKGKRLRFEIEQAWHLRNKKRIESALKKQINTEKEPVKRL